MSERNSLIAFFIAFLVGVTIGYFHYLKIKPTDEQKTQLQIDRVIRTELCDRLVSDIARFKEAPHSFKRTSLTVLMGESRESAKALLPDLPDSHPIQFHGNQESLFSECPTNARQWVKISAVFPEFYEQEKAFVESKKAQGLSLPGFFGGLPITQKSTERRVALVIGNSAYTARPLKNPVNDAKDIAQFLRNTGFTVTELLDADLAKMRAAVDRFSLDLSNNDVGLIYYSGHGIEYKGRNYFVPVNASIQDEQEIPRQAFDATEILEKVGRFKSGAMILIVDACRNSPIFSKFRSAKVGLETMAVPNGMIVAFSASPGQIAGDGNGRNSPYTAALIKEAQIPSRKIEDILKETRRAVSDETSGRQVPWYNSSLVGDFYFLKN